MQITQIRRPPVPAVLYEARATPWAHRLTLLSMFVYIAKVANVVPNLEGFGIGKVLIALALIALLLEGGGWWDGVMEHPLMRPFLWMLAAATLTLPFAIWRANSAHMLIDYYKDAVLVLLIVASTRTEEDLRRVVWAFVFNTLVLVAVLFKYGDTGVLSVKLGKNEIAMTAVMALGLALPMGTRGPATLLKWAVIGALIAGVLHSVSRGSYLGVGALGFVYLYRRFGSHVLVTVLVGGIVAYAAYMLLPESARDTVNTIIHYQQDYNLTSQQGRITIWHHALTVIAQHPLTGVGIGDFPIAEGALHPDGGEWMDAHNAALQVASEIGLLGFLAFAALLKRLLRAARRVEVTGQGRMREVGRAVFLGTIAYMVTGFFLSQGFSVILYVLLAIGIAMERIHAEHCARGTHVVPE